MGGTLSGLLALPGFALLALIVWAAGRRMARTLLPGLASPEATILGFILGMASLSVATTLLLFARLPCRVLLTVLLLAGAWIGRREAGSILESLRTSASDRVHAALVAVYATLGVIGCLAPETGWDTGVYHFTMARLRAVEGWMVVRFDLPHSFRPSYLESLYTVGFLFQGETFAALFSFSMYFAGLALARHWARSVAGDRAAFLAGLAFMGSTIYVLRTGGGDVEAGQALFLGAALYALGRLREGGGAGYRLVAAVGLGMTLGIKYAAAWAVVGVALVWPIVRWRDRIPWGRFLAESGVLAGVGLLVACPWYLRNLVVTGSATYPWGGEGVLSGGSLASEGTGWRTLAMTLGLDLSMALAIPVLLTAPVVRLRWAAISLGLFAVLLARQMGLSEVSAMNAFRYFSPAFLVLHVIGACGIETLLRRRWLAVGLLLACLAPALAIHALRNGRKIPAALGFQSRDAYLESRIDSYWAIRRAEGMLPPGRRILLVEQRAYYCRAPFLTATDIQSHVRFDAMKSASDFQAFLARESIGVIVWNRSSVSKTWGFRNLVGREQDLLRRAGVRVVEERADSVLYEVE